MIEIKIDRDEIKSLIEQEMKKALEETDNELLFWDSKELKRRTCMGWNTILDQFFHDPDFPKYKKGGKWYYPAEET
ncbi:group-specific protein [Geomicrobium sediminis]|uniref:Phage pi2 protein 07 n=1 Tax=Geomicrobium sediminis TaxID=1347788 RepID=A0ABS2P6W4_9BACL|nr:group-specific protein [Geomicrobium sediminis]MBM7631133.1 phage pi2 protein 07 [Geomicrobium sediminis]